MLSNYRKEWGPAIVVTMKSHQFNKTWTLENLSSGKKCIACKLIYKIKRNPNGSIDKFKARLIIKGYSQRKGEDYFETANEKMKLRQFEVSTAFYMVS